MACPYAHGPPLNTDIAGIGVRVSFYIQSLCHVYLSGKADSSFILSLRPEPDITFHDRRPLVAVVFALESCAVSAFTFLLWITAKTFGSTPACNANAFIFLFVPIHALKPGRIISLVLTGLGALGAAFSEADKASIQALWAIQTFIWISSVVNTELLIHFNHFAPPDGQRSPWQFGQILPMFLTIISLRDVYKALKGEAAASPTPSRPPLPPVWGMYKIENKSWAKISIRRGFRIFSQAYKHFKLLPDEAKKVAEFGPRPSALYWTSALYFEAPKGGIDERSPSAAASVLLQSEELELKTQTHPATMCLTLRGE
ncbi:hypothetical protein B0H13DRAFT_1883744 [Mycena leptocephala]|nr:hypothetical protein B0H13DRAFT_1883744 [Mycena leptocephala]